MRLTLLLTVMLTAFDLQAGGRDSAFEAGRAYYLEGQFGKAAACFHAALEAGPNDAEASYWAGMSYERLADINMPFGGKSISKAREYLTQAMKLAPGERIYRNALFDFLLNSAYSSRTALRDAAAILEAVPESDPDYGDMRRRFDSERAVNSSLNARLGRLFLVAPRAAYRIAALPASALSSRSVAASLAFQGQ